MVKDIIDSKKLSIIIPMYNVAQYLETCVASVQRQGLDEADYEILMINDGSPDNCEQKAKQLSSRYSVIKVISQENKGLGGARNTGIEHAIGTYLLFLDADDIYIDGVIPSLINIATANQLDILEYGAQGVDEQGNVIYEVAYDGGGEVKSGVLYYRDMKYMNSACNKLYRRSFLVDNKLVFLEKIYGEDFEFNTRALYFAERCMAIDTIVAKFLQTAGSITRSTDINKKRKYVEDLILILQNIKNFREKNEIKNKENTAFFDERMTMTNIDLFFQMFKYNFPFKEVTSVKQRLEKENLLYINHKVTDRNKNLFRKYLLGYNLFFFKQASMLKKMLGK
ncbi:glycosyltransferase family 2 protein [Aquimarina hainanensis]|uniref:Glycosyltransferase family 2 protein n=1 Tax=Aquimarina hainanensis TaxID=1578017 RepID=A0ABW5NCP3_9FLAO